jgi:leucyl-tRNA synthetase
MPRYNPAEIEPRWQRFWDENATFRCPEMPAGEKRYILDMFPYPSGDGLHVGHPEGYTATDIICRFERMCGKSVLHPMGFDAFGLPAEEHAIRTNTPPRQSTEANIANFRRQLKMLGFSYDWSRELATTDVGYFRWTQWIFLVMFDTWYDRQQDRGRPIADLPIPDAVRAEGSDAVRRYQDSYRLAFLSDALVNWCPELGTVLANEEVIDGKSERGDHPVQRLPLRQWMLRITAYADRLARDLEPLQWPSSVKTMQREWIGRSTGAEVDFFIGPPEKYETWRDDRGSSGLPAQGVDDVLRVYTTRPDTLFGATYMVIAPEHPFVGRLTTAEFKSDVEQYCAAAASKSDLDRLDLSKAKTGVFSGSVAVNPVNGEQIPIWIADYVLISYGTGAIMAVPAHDVRDFEFAQQFSLPIVPVVDPGSHEEVDREAVLAGKECSVAAGTAINSGDYDGLHTSDFKEKITTELQTAGVGHAAVNYKLRDWLFSRQRFWGEPFPILHELDEAGQPTGMLRAVSIDDLPIDLPHLDDYKPHGRPEPPLAKAPEDWLYPVIDGQRYRRETNTMPQWAGSCWYYLRFVDPDNDQRLIDPQKEKAWLPVDLYIGGAEHAVLHLLYARFWHKVLYDRGHVSTTEPFQRLVNQGMILGETEYTGYRRDDQSWVSSSEVRRGESGELQDGSGKTVEAIALESEQVEKRADSFVLRENTAVRVESRAYKMSKSRGNVVNPDDIVSDYGADALRLYEMFMGPLEQPIPWSMSSVNGVRNFLDRVWRMIIDDQSESIQLQAAVQDAEPTDEQRRVLHKTIKAVTNDIESLSFNTAIARMMEFVNFFTREKQRPKSIMESFVLLLSPMAPHIGEELWRALGYAKSLAYEPWPKYEEALTRDAMIEIPVQINGKVRARIDVPADISKSELLAMAKADERVQAILEGKQIDKKIVVPGRLVNFVVKEKFNHKDTTDTKDMT